MRPPAYVFLIMPNVLVKATDIKWYIDTNAASTTLTCTNKKENNVISDFKARIPTWLNDDGAWGRYQCYAYTSGKANAFGSTGPLILPYRTGAVKSPHGWYRMPVMLDSKASPDHAQAGKMRLLPCYSILQYVDAHGAWQNCTDTWS